MRRELDIDRRVVECCVVKVKKMSSLREFLDSFDEILETVRIGIVAYFLASRTTFCYSPDTYIQCVAHEIRSGEEGS